MLRLLNMVLVLAIVGFIGVKYMDQLGSLTSISAIQKPTPAPQETSIPQGQSEPETEFGVETGNKGEEDSQAKSSVKQLIEKAKAAAEKVRDRAESSLPEKYQDQEDKPRRKGAMAIAREAAGVQVSDPQDAETAQAKSQAQAAVQDVEEPGSAVFYLRNGDAVKGLIKHEDEEYYTVSTGSGSDTIIFKSEIESVRRR